MTKRSNLIFPPKWKEPQVSRKGRKNYVPPVPWDLQSYIREFERLNGLKREP